MRACVCEGVSCVSVCVREGVSKGEVVCVCKGVSKGEIVCVRVCVREGF